MLQAALNDGGPLAVVSNRSAACLHSFDSFVEGPVHVTVPTAHRHRSLTGAVVHLCAPLRPGDWTLLRGLRCTSPVRTIFDLAGCCSRVELENAIDSAVRNGGISLDYLSRQLQGVRRSGLSGVRILEEVLVDPGGTNGLECRFLKLCRQALLPKPACQVTHKRGSDLTIRPARSESN